MARLITTFGLIALTLWSQDAISNVSQIDSLKRLEKAAAHDTTRLRLLSQIAIAYSDSAYSTSIDTWRKALDIATRIKDRQQMGDIHHQIGYILYNQGEFNSALQEYNNALSVYQFINNRQEVARVYNDIGLVHKTWGKYEQAIESFLNGLEIFESISDEEGVGMVSNNIGQIYFFKEEYPNAIKYFTNYLVANEKGKHPRAVAGASNNIAAAYVELKNYDLALQYYSKALNIYDSLGVVIGVAILSDNIGMLHTNRNAYKEALEYHFKALELFKSINSHSRLSYTLKNIGVVYYMLGDYNSSDKYLLEAKDIALHYQQKETEKEIYFNLSQVYEAKNQPEKSLYYFKQMTALKDSLFNAEVNQNIASMELKYEAEKKERELKYIQRRLDQQKMLRGIFGSVLLMLTAIIVVLALDNRRKRKLAHKIIQRKKFLIQTLEHSIENQKDLPNEQENSPVHIFLLPKQIETRGQAQLVQFGCETNQVIISLYANSNQLPLAAIKMFLQNELQNNLSETHNSNEFIVELIKSKLFYTMDLFELKKDDIYSTALVVDCKSKRIDFNADSHNLLVCQSVEAQLLNRSDVVSFDKLEDGEPLLFPIVPYNSDNYSRFLDYLMKTAKNISDIELPRKIEVLQNTVESWNLSQSTASQLQLLAVSINCNQQVEICFTS